MELIDKRALMYQLHKQSQIDSKPRAIRRARRIVEEFPTVDAIPVEWLSKLADECAKDEDPYVQMNGLLINVVITKWEQRIEDEHETD